MFGNDSKLYSYAQGQQKRIFETLRDAHSMEKKHPILSFLCTILLFFLRLFILVCGTIQVLLQHFGLVAKKSKQGSEDSAVPAFNEISPPSPLLYKSLNPHEPLLPNVRILSQFCKFRYFCSSPNEFTAFRSFCTLHRKDRELQFILEMIHVIDYLCQGFSNARAFFDPQQVKLLLTFRQLPRSILVVNGKFLGSVVLPTHVPGENPAVWVGNATINLWLTYVLPTAKRRLSCVQHGFIGTPQSPASMDLQLRFMKLVDVFACAYRDVEKLLAAYSIEQIKREVAKKTEGTHVLKSQTMMHQWHNIRQYELKLQQQQQQQNQHKINAQ